MTYEDYTSELFVRFPSVQKYGFTSSSFKCGLDGMTHLDRLLSHPWKSYPCVHVAGTNGKGSVCSMIAASLSSEGMRVGLYTSPHILDFRERIKIVRDGGYEMISREEVVEFLDKYLSQCGSLSFFEITTGMAFWWFRKRAVDAAVIEVGLGGRLDSTNIIEPAVSVVTSIGLDHCAVLGDSRPAIAFEKAGIFKKDVPAVVGFRDGETSSVFESAASRVGAPLYFVEGKFASVQDNNAATASLALRLMGRVPNESAIGAMAQITGLHCRWETILDNPEVIADIGHNSAALKQNFERLEASGRPLFIVYGIMADKDLGSIIPIMPAGARYFLCAPAIPRALEVDRLYAGIGSARPQLNTVACSSVADAVEKAIVAARRAGRQALVYVGGSTFVVSDALQFLKINC